MVVQGTQPSIRTNFRLASQIHNYSSTSSETVINWYNIAKHHAGPISGEGTTVEIEESNKEPLQSADQRTVGLQWHLR